VFVDNAWVTAYFDDIGHIAIVQVHPNGRLQAVIVPSLVPPFDAHQAISLGVDGQCRLHVAYGAHNSHIMTFRSKSSTLSDGFDDQECLSGDYFRRASSDATLGLTYPMFIPTDDALILLARRGPHYDGEIVVGRFSCQSDEWIADPAPLISGRGLEWTAGPYVNSPVLMNGEITLFYVWRLDPKSTGLGEMANVGVDCIKSTSALRRVFTTNGTELRLPVTPVNSDRLVALGVGRQLMNQCGASFAPTLGPVAVTYWSDQLDVPQFRLVWTGPRRGGSSSQITKFKTKFTLSGRGTLPLPHSRPQILFDESAYAYVFFRSIEVGNRLCVDRLSPPNYTPESARRQVIVDEDLGYYEPVIGKDLWHSEGRVAIFVQRCEQYYGSDGRRSSEASIARLIVLERS